MFEPAPQDATKPAGHQTYVQQEGVPKVEASQPAGSRGKLDHWHGTPSNDAQAEQYGGVDRFFHVPVGAGMSGQLPSFDPTVHDSTQSVNPCGGGVVTQLHDKASQPQSSWPFISWHWYV